MSNQSSKNEGIQNIAYFRDRAIPLDNASSNQQVPNVNVEADDGTGKHAPKLPQSNSEIPPATKTQHG